MASTRSGNAFVASVVTALVLGWVTAVSAQDRMPPIPADEMTEAQREIAAKYEAERGSTIGTGPWAPLLRTPEILRLMLDMRMHVRDRTLLGARLSEFAMLIAAREWTQQYVWNAHRPAAIRAGLSPEIITALAAGRRPQQMAEDEEILYDLCMELHRNKSVSDATYARALAAFKEEGIIEAVAIEGYYALIAMVMNTTRTPLRDGVPPPLVTFPR